MAGTSFPILDMRAGDQSADFSLRIDGRHNSSLRPATQNETLDLAKLLPALFRRHADRILKARRKSTPSGSFSVNQEAAASAQCDRGRETALEKAKILARAAEGQRARWLT